MACTDDHTLPYLANQLAEHCSWWLQSCGPGAKITEHHSAYWPMEEVLVETPKLVVLRGFRLGHDADTRGVPRHDRATREDCEGKRSGLFVANARDPASDCRGQALTRCRLASSQP